MSTPNKAALQSTRYARAPYAGVPYAGAPYPRAIVAAVFFALAALPACGGDEDTDKKDEDTATAADAGVDGGTTSDTATSADTVTKGGAYDCDPLQPTRCALPWPSNLYLAKDSKTTTGYRLNFGAKTLPRNLNDKHVYSDAYKRLDGYGVGSAVLVHFPGIDIKDMASESKPDVSVTKKSPSLLIEIAKDGSASLVPHFVELDQTGEKDQQVLFLRPLVILNEATRYIVAFHGLKTTDGKAIKPSDAFAKLRDGKTTGTDLAHRQAGFDDIFGLLDKAGIKKADLVLSWDFVTASTNTLHGDLLHVRDKGFAIAGSKGPELKITKTVDNSKNKKANWAYELQGTFTVPRFTRDHMVGSFKMHMLNFGKDGKPAQNGTITRDFWIRVPHTALDGTPHGLAQYGHGLLGRGSQVGGGHNAYLAREGKLIFFACDWSGMASADNNGIAAMIVDMSDFPVLVDGLHQGMLEGLLLARAMRERFAGMDFTQKHGIKIDKKRLVYTGISQGGIYGGTLMALSQDITRGHLGVPGQNYATLLHRSVDFQPFFAVMMGTYGNAIDRAILLTAGQSLWDMVDPSSHYVHLKTKPHNGTPKHEVLLASATGDYQVALLTNEITVRSGWGVKLMKHYGKAVYGVKETPFPHKGSGLVNWSFGNPWPKPGNVPPADDIDGLKCGPSNICLLKKDCDPKGVFAPCKLKDPHGKPRKMPNHQKQLLHFLDTGEIIDVCNDSPCDPF